MNGFVDLHIHTIMSDGKYTPAEIVEKAVKLGLKAIAITDHDTVLGVKEALAAAEKSKEKIEIVPGVEISCYEPEMGFGEVHVLGYFVDTDSKPLNDLLLRAKQERIKQKKKIIKKLQEFGFEITFKEVAALVKGEIGRPHIAHVLLEKYPDKFSSTKEIFNQYIDNKGPAFVDREHLTRMKEAVDAIIHSGGLPVLSHPVIPNEENFLELINYFVECGGKGIETYYSYSKLYDHKDYDKKKEQETIAKLKQIAKEKNLVETGGSDYHKDDRGSHINEMKVPYSVLEKLKALKKH